MPIGQDKNEDIAKAIREERKRIADGVRKQRLSKVKNEYDKGWNDAIDVIVAAIS